MSIIIDNGSSPMELSSDFVWLDEFDWQSLKAEVNYTIGGVPIIQQSVQGGRPITLGGANAIITYANLKILYAWAELPSVTYQLTHPSLDTSPTEVIFRHWEEPVLEAVSPIGYSQPDNDYIYTLTIKFAEFSDE